MPGEFHRRLPVGAEVLPQGGVHFRVWAPASQKVEVLINSESENPIAMEMGREPGGYFGATAPDVRSGVLYGYRLDGTVAYPDPSPTGRGNSYSAPMPPSPSGIGSG